MLSLLARAQRAAAFLRPAHRLSCPTQQLASSVFKPSLRLSQQVRPLSSANTAAPAAAAKTLTRDTMNKQVVAAEYAVRGELVIKAAEYSKKLEQPNNGLPFKEIVLCNIGNPQELGQAPITFFRQVLALMTFPHMLENKGIIAHFPKDAVARARAYLARLPGGTGAYSQSQGIDVVREEVAQYIADRDGHPANAGDIFLTDGASPAVKMMLTALIRDKNDGILTPIPQYPLYSATIALQGGSQVGYYLDESHGWGLQVNELRRSLKEARAKGTNVRALVVINPGNPTGQCLPEQNIRDIVQFCREERLVLLADEVYQTNIYSSTPFTSFKKVVRDLGPSYNDFELVSFHSVSKGFVGECGRRGGYMELCGIDPAVKFELYKLASVSLCSNVDGQVMVGLMVNPPRPGDESYALYDLERQGILRSLQNRAKKLVRALNEMPGINCNSVDGALYAFPQITLPPKAVAAAQAAGKKPDVYYCLRLLEATGICVVPGSGFGQRDGTWHFRTTILPSEAKFDGLLNRLQGFHNAFMKQYA